MLKRIFLGGLTAVLSLSLIVSGFGEMAVAVDRTEQATVVGKDKSQQSEESPTDAKTPRDESKMKKESAQAGLKSDNPDMTAGEKMQKPKQAERDRDKPKKPDNKPVRNWFIGMIFLAAIATALK
ncbi:hypothetical protein HY522_10525 [bacterium]|nr:hypothetical protein [bacterium]